MNRIAPLLIAALTCSVPQLASAVPVRATFDGTVSGSSVFANVLNDFPVGTAASFDVSFDDTGLVDSAANATDFDLAPVSGWMRLGSLEWLFDAGRIWTYTYTNDPGFPVVSYGLQLTGSGPTISNGAASIFGLFLQLTPDATPYSGRDPMAGFRYPFDGGEFYSYANLSGTFSTSRQTTSVPEPSTGLLMGSALLLLGFLRRSRRSTRGVRAG
ncbi:MAG: PEP-CTERM sorting domain-containing protein [Steroidobacteraceae bacterium]